MVEPAESHKSVENPRRRRDSRTAPPAAPLSRRQLRDREQAEAEAEAQHRSAAAQASAGLSRRELRERELDERYSERPAVVDRVPDAVARPDAPVAPEPVVEPVPAVEPDPVVDTVPEPDPEPVVDTDPVVEPEPVLEPEPTPEPELEPAIESEPESDPEPVVVEAAPPKTEPAADAPISRRGRRARAGAPIDVDPTVTPEPSAEVTPEPASEPAAEAPDEPAVEQAPEPAVDERMLAVANLETVPLEIELVAQHPVVEGETAEHIAAETVLSAEVDFAEPHVAPEPFTALATSGADEASKPVPIASPRVRRSVPVAELMSSSSGTFVSHARSQPIKRRVLAGFVMMIAALFVVSLSIPSLGFATPSDFQAVQSVGDVTDSQNLSVGEGPALNAVRDDFYAEGAPGSLYSTTNSYVSKESQKLAQELMAAVAAGRLKGSVPDHIPEIQALADGVVKPDCGIDLRILQVMVIAVRSFNTVAVSDINRKCTGQIEGGGTSSSHYTNGGGHAVDFYLINGASVPGADANTVKFAEILDPIMPPGSNLGQGECRSSAGISLNLQNFKEFSDSCTHMHIDVGNATEGLNVNLDTDFK
ncbi:hypothetical protein ASF06_05115 [Agreia sp. Leaf244]|uniref:hypothetical protein n=1 Tax=Agreia sp. Leaf244 TaxID=1736305 RepID=UPI0006FBF368|nr:hypothetical protein [Agreia sp. Leaf244]KQO09645.1 hypothetical protein ASF06_05115 [Agreia sp. Leaf244]